MPIKTFKPTTPSRRFTSIISNLDLTKKEPEKSLVVCLKSKGGRNNSGEITVRHKGGGHKRLYRIIDFKRDKFDVPAKVMAIEYDPNRNSRIALLQYNDGEKRYIILPEGLNIGDTVASGAQVEIKVGNALSLKNITEGTIIHNIELVKGRGGQLVRSAGSFAQLMAKEGDYAQIKMPSGEIRLIPLDCMATIGQVSNIDYKNISIGKAGKSRWLGIRPTVRGTAMNAVDHPHGGGRGKSKGHNHPVSPWGQPAKGGKTRSTSKYSERFIVAHRPKGVRG